MLSQRNFTYVKHLPYIVCGGGLVFKSYPTLVTPWTIAHQAPLSVGFPRQEYWNRFPFPSPDDLPNPGIKPKPPTLPALQVDSLCLSHQGSSTYYGK